MGMIFLYIHIPHIFFISFPHNRHKQTIPAGSPVPCLFIYSLSAYISLVGFFSRRPTLRSCFRFRPRRPVFRRGPRCGGLRFAFTGLPPRRLVGRAVVRVAPYRSVPFLVSSGVSSERCAVFVSSFSRVVSSGRCGLAGSFAPVVPLVGSSWRFGFLASRRSSREASREASRLVLP